MWREISAALLAFVVMFWNVENLFDPFDDPLKNDDEFISGGERHWSWPRFEKKCDGIAQTILAAADEAGELPALVGLAEVENRMVVSHLVRKTMLSELGYGFVHRESPDERGIDVALLYRRDRFRVLAVDSLRVPGFATRDILYVKGFCLGREAGAGADDSLHVFVVHLPSRRGGARASQLRRAAALERLGTAVDSLMLINSGSRVVVMGDFNDTADGLGSSVLLRMEEGTPGTLKYHGRWEQIDHFFLSESIFEQAQMQIFAAPFLMEPDKTYRGMKPRRTYNGPLYNGGLSDHLPIILRLFL